MCKTPLWIQSPLCCVRSKILMFLFPRCYIISTQIFFSLIRSMCTDMHSHCIPVPVGSMRKYTLFKIVFVELFQLLQ